VALTVTRAVLTVVLLLAFAAQAASAVHAAACPMLQTTADRSGCEHCPPPPPEVTLRAALPDCCVLHAATVETSVSEPVRTSHPSSTAAVAVAHVVVIPVALPPARAALPASHAPAPPPPPRNLPLLS
jgi:hypothetical protein